MNKKISEFLKILFPDLFGGFIELRTFPPTNGKTQHFFSSIDALIIELPKIEQWSQYSNIFFGVCPRSEEKGSKGSVKNVWVLWADVDAKSFKGGKNEALAKIRQFPLPPTVIIDSGHGFHLYWRLKEAEQITNQKDLIRIESFLKAIVPLLKADPAAAELARILRFPGTLNLKEKPLPVSIVELEPSRQYNLSDFEDFLDVSVHNEKEYVSKESDWISDLLSSLANGNRNNTFAKVIGRLHHDKWSKKDILALLTPHAEKHNFPLEELQNETEGICKRYSNSSSENTEENSEKKALDDYLKVPLESILADEALKPIKEELDIIPSDINKVELSIKLSPILKRLAHLPFGVSQAFICEKVKTRFSLNVRQVDAFRSELNDYRKNNKQKIRNKEKNKPIQTEAIEQVQMSEEEKKEALTLLKQPDFLDRFLNEIEQLGCVGEKENKKLLYLAMTSRKLQNPISVTVKGESATGKSFLVIKVYGFFPKEDVFVFSALSAKALFHSKRSFKNKVLTIFERQGGEDADYSIRTFQSEGKLILGITVKNKETNEFEMKEIEVEGPVSFIETTTKPTLHPENETRSFDIFTDDSEKQTIDIKKQINRKYLDPFFDRNINLKPWINAQRLLQPCKVYIPYIDKITFPSKPVRIRRDYQRFLALIESSTILHQFQRNQKLLDEGTCIEASIEDYKNAYEISKNILFPTIFELSPTAQKFLEYAEDKEFTRTDLVSHFGLDRKTVTKHLEALVNQGYLDEKQERKGAPYFYKKLNKLSEKNIILSPEDLEASINKDELSTLSTPIQTGDNQYKSLKSHNILLDVYHGNEINKTIFPHTQVMCEKNNPSSSDGQDGHPPQNEGEQDQNTASNPIWIGMDSMDNPIPEDKADNLDKFLTEMEKLL